LLAACQFKVACSMPAVAVNPVGTDGTSNPPVQITPAKVAVPKFVLELSWLQNASPPKFAGPMLAIVVDPNCVQFTLSTE
jgi:hypothetical protein